MDLQLYVGLVFVLKVYLTGVESCPLNCDSACNDADGGCSECKEGWFGRQCNYPLECYIGRGFKYSGTKSETYQNMTCQAWSVQTPNTHSLTRLSDQQNYCRNPNPDDGDTEPYCYQMREGRWNYCGVPECSTQCPAPNLLVFGDVINPPSSGFVKGFVVEVITGGCGGGSRGKMICQEDLTWSTGFDCIEIPGWCTKPVVAEPSYIVDSRNEFYYNNHTDVLCRDGYEIAGSNQITCQADKSWGSIPPCTRVKCGNSSLNPNSVIINSKSSYEYEDEITIACIPGYDIIGQTTLKCLGNRQWSHEMPTCKVVECSQPNLNENSYVLNKETTYIYRDQINIGCHNGYTIKGTSSFTCGADKSWSGSFPICEPVPCNKPSLPPNTGLLSQTNSYVYKDQARLTCAKGFELEDSDTITCLANGTWGTIPECTGMQCLDLNLPSNVLISNPMKNEFYYKNKVTFECKEGYKLSHKNSLECQADKTWNREVPFCIEICDGLSTSQWVGITSGLILISVLVTAFISILATHRFLYRRKTEGTISNNSVNTNNEAFNYEVVDVNMRDEPHVYSTLSE